MITAYQGFHKNSREEIAVLIFADNRTEAKRVGWEEFRSIMDTDECGKKLFMVRRLKNQKDYLKAMEVCNVQRAFATAEIPPGFTCDGCNQWGMEEILKINGYWCINCLRGDS